MIGFADRLANAVQQTRTPVLVGLDPRVESLPDPLRPVELKNPSECAEAYRRFCCGVIDAVASLVPAVKPQAAFFEELGPHGMTALADVIQYARSKNLVVVLDGKRNDIGSTATAYATGYLGEESAWQADALTVSPYLGDDSLSPFIEVAQARGAGVFVLAKTSNPGGRTFQDLSLDGKPLYRRVAEYIEGEAAATAGASAYGAVGAVVGATYPEQLVELRGVMPHAWLLIPGFGSQGGTAKDVAGAFDTRGLGAIINNSRGIIFAHSREPFAARFGARRWQEAVEAATLEMIEQLRSETAAGKL